MCKIKTSFSQSESFRSCTASIFLTNTSSTAITREVEIKKEKSDFFRFFPFSASATPETVSSPRAWAPAAPSPRRPARGPRACVPAWTPARAGAAGWGWPAPHSPWRCWAGLSAVCPSAASPRKTSAGWRRARPRGSGGAASSCPLCPWIGPPGGGRDPWRGGAGAGTPRPRCRWRRRWTDPRPRSPDRSRPLPRSAPRSCWREARGSRLAAGTGSPAHRNIQSELLEQRKQLLLSESPTHTHNTVSYFIPLFFRTNSSIFRRDRVIPNDQIFFLYMVLFIHEKKVGNKEPALC